MEQAFCLPVWISTRSLMYLELPTYHWDPERKYHEDNSREKHNDENDPENLISMCEIDS